MTWLAPGALVLLLAACCAWFAWDLHVRYGPVIVGNARWRRELPQRQAEREARQAEREALAALADDDRAWLREMGWRDRLAHLAAPAAAELTHPDYREEWKP